MKYITKHPVIIAGTGPGDPELITVKAHRAIQEADVIVYDSQQTEAVLEMKKPGAQIVKLDKQKDIPEQEVRKSVAQTIAGFYEKGKKVVRLKVGDAFMFGRGATEVQWLHKFNVETQVVPGVTAGIAAAGTSAVRITEKGEADMAVFYMAAQKTDQQQNLLQLANTLKNGATAIIYMAEDRLDTITKTLKNQGLPGSFPVIAVSNATLENQLSLTATLETIATEILSQNLPAPIVFFMGKYVTIN